MKTKYGPRMYFLFSSLRDYSLLRRGSLAEYQSYRPVDRILCQDCKKQYNTKYSQKYKPYLQNIPPLNLRFRALPNTKPALMKAVVRGHHVIFVILQRVTKNGERGIGVTVDAVFGRPTSLEGLDDEHVTRIVTVGRRLRLEGVLNYSFGGGRGVAEKMHPRGGVHVYSIQYWLALALTSCRIHPRAYPPKIGWNSSNIFRRGLCSNNKSRDRVSHIHKDN